MKQPSHIEDVYPLSPLQQGILFHCLESPLAGVYCEQVAAELVVRPSEAKASADAPVAVPVLAHAWKQVVERHAVLRTGFLWRGLKEPAQVVHRRVRPEVDVIDLRGLARTHVETRLGELQDADRRRGFDFERPPLFRLSVVLLDARRCVLVWTFHHLLLDGWSIPRVLAEVFGTYRALRSGQAAPEWPSPPPYKRYIGWLRKRDRAAAQEVWTRQLAGLGAPTPLPAPVPAAHARRSEEASELRYRTRVIKLPPRLGPALQAHCRQLGVTLGTLMQGIWAVLLRRYSGRDDVLFGLVNSGRPPALPGVETMIGLFINTVPVRARFAPGMSWASALRQLQAESAEWQPHSYVPLADLQGWSDVPRGQPLFESLLVVENYPRNPASASQGLGFDVQLRPQQLTTSYPLTLAVLPQEDFSVFVVRDQRRFSDTFALRVLEHVRTLLEAVAGLPAETSGETLALEALPLLTRGERQQLVVEWSIGGAARSIEMELLDAGNGTLDGRVFARAAKRPEAIAVVDAGDRHAHWLSYGELARRAERAADVLHRQGVQPDQPVPVELDAERPRNVELVIQLLAILRAGGAYLPIDPGLPEERRRWMLADAVADLQPFAQGCLAAQPHSGSLSLAYLLYTSGSTGRPKGVAVPHRAVLRLVDQHARALRSSATDVYLQLAPIEFDAATLELWAPLTAGGRLVLYPGRTPDLDRLQAVLCEQRVDTLWLTAGFFQQLAEERPTLLRGVRRLLTGGDVVPPGAVRRLRRVLPGVQVINGYGPTENTTFTTFQPFSDNDLREAEQGAPLSIGRPLDATTVYVLSHDLRPVPAAVPGELFTGGEGLARGYHGLPSRTAVSFVPDPFADAEGGGGRLYRTGDLARWRGDGRLDFLGRLDNQVKLRGFRVEPGEIESVLASHPAVETAAVVVAGQGASGKRLLAWVVLADAGEPDGILDFLRARLPAPLVPSALGVLDALPLTSRGKVDRRQLARRPAPDASSLARRPPSTATERRLAALWSELLEVEEVFADDDFFELGGHSLLAMRLVARLRQDLKVDLPVGVLFETPTVAALALRVDQQQADAERAALPPLHAVERTETEDSEAVLPLSFAQERLWFLARLEPHSPAYNIPLPLLLRGQLRPAAFEAAWLDLVRRHEVLRTRFDEQDGRAVQRIGDPSRPAPWWLQLVWIDLSALDAAARRRQVVRLAIAETLRPFDLRTGPMVRAVVLRGECSAGGGIREHALLLNLHHIAGDGWSLGVLVRELAALYTARVEDTHLGASLPSLPVQYGDFAVWQRGWLTGEVLQRQVEYWRTQLADLPPLFELPTDGPRPAVQSLRGATLPVRFGAARSTALRQLAQRHGATPFMVLLALFHLLLGRWADRRDPVVGSPVAGRRHPAVEGLIGFFVNTLVLRGDLSSAEDGETQTPTEPSFAELLRRARRQALDAYAHQDLPFEKLVDELRPERSRAYSPVFQIMLGLQNAPVGDAELPDLELRPLIEAVGGSVPQGVISKFDLSLMLGEAGADSALGAGSFHGELEYCVDLFDVTSMQRLRRQLFALLDAATEAPDVPARSLSILDAAQRHQLLREWNDTAQMWPAPATLPAVLAARAASQPGATAAWLPASEPDPAGLDGEDLLAETLSYGDLQQRVVVLAQQLHRLGVSTETRVALSLERGLEMWVAMLAVLAAGGAYVPLDPAFPAQRRSFMLHDSGARWLLVDDPHGTQELELPPGVRVLPLAELLVDPETEAGGTQLPVIDPDQLAYVLYTSGSTGRPKGVQISHGSLLNFLRSMARRPGLAASDLLLAVTTISFDIAGLELYLPLVCGAQLTVVPREVAMHGDRLARLLSAASNRVALASPPGKVVVQATPATWRLLLDSRSTTGGEWLGLPEGRRLLALCGGEALPVELARRLRQRGAELWNVYGPTETTIWSTLHPLGGPLAHVEGRTADAAPRSGTASLGRPLANTDVHLLDAALRPVAPGAWGDLYIGGAGLARGYLGRPALTAERFIPNPFSNASSVPAATRLYATGDVARRRGDGDLEFRGRRDTQVKVRGFRIELGEIEARLAQLPGVSRAVAHVHTGLAGGTQLVAYLVLDPLDEREATPPAEESVREHLRQHLPDYMIPAAVLVLDALPLTPNGKLDRRALPAPELPEAAYEPPAGWKEEALAAAWMQVLQVERVGAGDAFFRLGGDSILVLQAIAAAREGGLALEPGWFFQYPTLRELAERAEPMESIDTVPAGSTASESRATLGADGVGPRDDEDDEDDFGWSDDDFDELSDAVDEMLG